MSVNLMAPIVFEDGEIDIFIRDHVCALCLGHLNKRPTNDRRWWIECPSCGAVLPHNHTTKVAAEQYINGRRAAATELKAPTGKTEAEIMRELGF